MPDDPADVLSRLGALIAKHGVRLDPWLVQSVISRADGKLSPALRMHGRFSLLLKGRPAEAAPAERAEAGDAADAADAPPAPPARRWERTLPQLRRARVRSAAERSAALEMRHDEIEIDDLERLLETDPDAPQRAIEMARPVGLPVVPAEEAGPQVERPSLPWTPAREGSDGRNIIIGVVDYGFDFLHRCLRDGNSTRILALWDQNAEAGNPPGIMDDGLMPPVEFAYGAEYDAAAIQRQLDHFLAEVAEIGEDRATAEHRQAAYDLGYDPAANYYDPAAAQAGLHGTHVTSIAAGSPIDGFEGVAPKAGIIAVQLGIASKDWVDGGAGGRRWPTGPGNDGPPSFLQYSDVGRLVDAVQYIVARARSLHGAEHPVHGVVVNLSLGTWGGAHDGRSLFEREIDALVTQYEEMRRSAPVGALPMLAIVCCAGNAGSIANHVQATLTTGQSFSFEWRIDGADQTANELEVWYAPDADVTVTLIAPAGALGEDAVSFAIPRGGAPVLITAGERVIGYASHHSGTTVTPPRPNHVDVVIDPTAAGGNGGGNQVWTVTATAVDAPAPIELHAWVERDLGAKSTLFAPNIDTNSHPAAQTSLSSICCGAKTIVVSGCGARDGNDRFSELRLSSCGPRPWVGIEPPVAVLEDATRPHVCAQGGAVRGAKSGTANQIVFMHGTSQAAPQVAGAIARMMQKAAPLERDEPRLRFTTDDFRAALQEGGRLSRTTAMDPLLYVVGDSTIDWHARYGTGPLDIDRAITALMGRGPTG